MAVVVVAVMLAGRGAPRERVAPSVQRWASSCTGFWEGTGVAGCRGLPVSPLAASRGGGGGYPAPA